jgi:hypothetical protein
LIALSCGSILSSFSALAFALALACRFPARTLPQIGKQYQGRRSSAYQKTPPLKLDDGHEAPFSERQGLAQAQVAGSSAA